MTLRALPEAQQAEILPCLSEFGYHTEHEDCDWLIAEMSNPGYPAPDYSDWYGGERGYQDGLRWSDFV